MQSLIDDNTRLLLFAHGEGMTSCYANECEDGILYARDHFAVTATNDVESCEATLGGDTNIGFFQMKNYEDNKVKWPSENTARDLNSYATLEARLGNCKGQRLPNLLSVDFWDVGDVLDFVEAENKKRGGVTGGEYNEDVVFDGGGGGDDSEGNAADIEEVGNNVTAAERSGGSLRG
eukprot:scaffold696_cov197-Alexandrium_tamarense.AAC.6